MAFLLFVTFVPKSFHGQKFQVDPQQRQKLLGAVSTQTMQQELDQAGELGFRVIHGTTRGNGELVLLLERDLRSNQKFQIHLISTQTTATFKREIADDALQGFRAVPRTFLNKGGEMLIIMEREANPRTAPKRYEYNLLSADQTSTVEKEWMAALGLNYTPIAMITRREVMLLLER
jgi:hypothetical protein